MTQFHKNYTLDLESLAKISYIGQGKLVKLWADLRTKGLLGV